MRRRPRLATVRLATTAMIVVGQVSSVRAEDLPEAMPVAFGADQVRLDPHARAIDASGNVHVEQPPFHLKSDALRLRRVPIGVELEGEGSAAFCAACAGSPLAVRFRGATMAPPHDLILRNPVLEVFGIPIAWLPVIWLRSAARVGALPPEVAWRGSDGLFAGAGVHLPWRNGDGARGVDLRAGAYFQGGLLLNATMRTAISETRVAWDRYKGDDGVTLFMRGATAIAEGERPDSAAWDVDALRGARALKATTDINAAALPFDRAEGEVAWREGGWTFASGVRTVALRGGDLLDLGVGGPMITARRSDAIANAGAYDATIEGGAVNGAGLGTTSFGRAEASASLAARIGVVGTSVTAHGVGVIAEDAAGLGVGGGAQVRASLGLPFARGFASAADGADRDGGDPWVHRTEPRLEAAGLATQTSSVLPFAMGRGVAAPGGRAWVASAGWYNAIGRSGSRSALEFDACAGVLTDDHRGLPLLRARAAVNSHWVALDSEFARVVWRSGDGGGGAFVARARFGSETSVRVSAHAAERDGVDPLQARALVDAPLEPASGFLASPGWTGGARLGVPFGPRVTTRGGVDYDFGSRELVAAIGMVELHDACNCVVVRTSAAHRVGRDGMDVWLSIDIRGP